MAYLLSAHCPCGYTAETRLGAGPGNHGTHCSTPCYCAACRQVVTVNVLAPSPACPHCGAPAPQRFDDPALCADPSAPAVASWCTAGAAPQEWTVSSADHRCPRCARLSLRFAVEALHD